MAFAGRMPLLAALVCGALSGVPITPSNGMNTNAESDLSGDPQAPAGVSASEGRSLQTDGDALWSALYTFFYDYNGLPYNGDVWEQWGDYLNYFYEYEWGYYLHADMFVFYDEWYWVGFGENDGSWWLCHGDHGGDYEWDEGEYYSCSDVSSSHTDGDGLWSALYTFFYDYNSLPYNGDVWEQWGDYLNYYYDNDWGYYLHEDMFVFYDEWNWVGFGETDGSWWLCHGEHGGDYELDEGEYYSCGDL